MSPFYYYCLHFVLHFSITPSHLASPALFANFSTPIIILLYTSALDTSPTLASPSATLSSPSPAPPTHRTSSSQFAPVMKRSRDSNATGHPLPSDVHAMSVPDRVDALRQLMRKHSITAYIVPSDDAHMSEYVADCDRRRAFITGFDGSAGTALITLQNAYLWTDGRYTVQATAQLDSNVYQLMRMYEQTPLEQWIPENLPVDAAVFVDGLTVSVATVRRLQAAISNATPASRIVIKPLPQDVPNLIDQIWASAKPSHPASAVFVHPVQYAGASAEQKIRLVRDSMREKACTILMVCALDEVAWLLNLRGADVDYNPVFWAYAVVTLHDVTLYVNSTRFQQDVHPYLKQAQVKLAPYDSLLHHLAARQWTDDDCVWLDPSTCNYAILNCIEHSQPNIQTVKKRSPISLFKARKNPVELDGMRNAHIRDGAALVKFLAWLEHQVVHLHNTPTECEAADHLEKIRSTQKNFVSLSFSTISGFGANGAVVHYQPQRDTAAKITTHNVYLVDSGAQYRDGTTDVTRTLHLGEPTAWQKECFTRVLQGHIAIDASFFPEGTTGLQVDAFARRALWNAGLDYSHGTGHGVGSFMNVHEGPHVISFKAPANATPLEAGFITSNEPGYYEEGQFGIRIENLCIIKEASVKGPPTGKGKRFFGIEHITICPIHRKMIDVSLLSAEERKWVDKYHEECREKLTPFLKDDEMGLEWLRKNTEPLEG